MATVETNAHETNNVGKGATTLARTHTDAWVDLLKVANDLSVRVDRDLQLSTGGMTLDEFDVLRLLNTDRAGIIGITALSESTRLSRSATTRLVDRMAAKTGFVQKRDDTSDKRATWVEITPAGRNAMKTRLRAAYEKAVRAHFANALTYTEALALIALLKKLK